MSITSVLGLLVALRQSQLLDADQLDELPTLVGGCAEPQDLARELLRRGWLTLFQVGHLFQGRTQDLFLGRYVLLEPLGRGGMGQVYKARHRRLDRTIALKLIRSDQLADPEVVRRFQRESRAVGRLAHPNVITIHDADEVNGTHFFAMEYVEGTDLARLVEERGPLPAGEACEYIRQAALGLQHAHERGLVHRDVKPANLLVTPAAGAPSGAVVKVLDLGLARLQRLTEEERLVSMLTADGALLGTLDYQAPEQATDPRSVDIRADVYSLGCTLYHLLTGKAPFAEYTSPQKLLCHQRSEPVPLEQRRPGLPRGLSAVVRRMMAKLPGERYQTPAEVATALLPFAGVVRTGAARVWCATAVAAVRKALARLRQPWHTAPPSSVQVPAPLAALASVVGAPQHVPSARSAGKGALACAAGSGAPRTAEPPRAQPTGIDSLACSEPVTTPTVPAEPLAARRTDEVQATTPELALQNALGMKLAFIPPGLFAMGSSIFEIGRCEDEGPLHEVVITRPFYLGVCPVTQAEYERVLGRNPASFRTGRCGGPQHPVENVTWEDAVGFCRRLSEWPEEKEAGHVYRLPTEAEWEYACRAGTTTPFFHGASLSPEQANFDGTAPYGGAAPGPCPGRTTPVGAYEPNAFGLYDLHGNVWEWCADWYDKDYYALIGPREDPTGPAEPPARDPRRVLRGGSWYSQGAVCRSAVRYPAPPAGRYNYVGFRVVLALAGSSR